MVPNWKNWCRLCAQENSPTEQFSLLNSEQEPYLDAICKYFCVDMTLEDFPNAICPQCHQFVAKFISFLHRASRVQTMFYELVIQQEEIADLNQLKAQYDLQEPSEIEIEIKILKNSELEEECGSKHHNNRNREQSIELQEIEYVSEEEVSDRLNVKQEDLDEDEDHHLEDEWHPYDLQHAPDEDKDLIKTTNCGSDHENDGQESEANSNLLKPKKRGRPKTTANTFSCEACKIRFPTYPKYKKHMLDVHEDFTDSCQNHESNPEQKKSKVACPYCDKTFTKITVVQNHIKARHSGEKPFICEECGKGCRTFGALKEHKLTHTEETPFKCCYCEKSFKNNSRLKTHLDTHNETNYICTSCGLQLNTRRTLKMHMLVHSDQKRHKCDFCGNEYKRAKALKNHLILHTGLKPYRCNFCDKTFANGSNCRTHKKKSHPVELAAMEAAGTKVINSNIPKLENLRAVTANKSVLKDTMGSLVSLDQEFGSTVSIASMVDDAESTSHC